MCENMHLSTDARL